MNKLGANAQSEKNVLLENIYIYKFPVALIFQYISCFQKLGKLVFE